MYFENFWHHILFQFNNAVCVFYTPVFRSSLINFNQWFIWIDSLSFPQCIHTHFQTCTKYFELPRNLTLLLYKNILILRQFSNSRKYSSSTILQRHTKPHLKNPYSFHFTNPEAIYKWEFKKTILTILLLFSKNTII